MRSVAWDYGFTLETVCLVFIFLPSAPNFLGAGLRKVDSWVHDSEDSAK